MSIQSDIEMLSIEALEHLVFESRKDTIKSYLYLLTIIIY